MTGTVYSIDSSALINGWCRVYRPKNFGFIWEQLDALITDGRLRSSIEVYSELEKKDDDLFAWCKARKEAMFVEIDEDTQKHVARIMKDHPRLVDTAKGRSGADPFVIALALTASPVMTVVTEETPGKSKITDPDRTPPAQRRFDMNDVVTSICAMEGREACKGEPDLMKRIQKAMKACRSRRLRPEQMTSAQALQAAKTFAGAERDKEK